MSAAIRDAAEGDIAAVCKIEFDSFPSPWRESDFRDALANPLTAFVAAEEEGELVGYAIAYILPPEAEIINIAVSKEARRRGIGRALMGELAARFSSSGVGDSYLEVRASNNAAQALYRAFGYAECGVRRGYYSNPREDAILMHRGV